MSQPLPVSAKPENQDTLASKQAETTPAAMKTQPTLAPIKAAPTEKGKTETTSLKMEKPAIEASSLPENETAIPTAAKVSPVTEEKQPTAAPTAEPTLPSMAPLQQTLATAKADVPSTDVARTATVKKDKEEAVKQTAEPKPDLSQVKDESSVEVSPSVIATEVAVAPASPAAAEPAMPADSTGTETQPEAAAQEKIVIEAQPDHIKLTETTKSLHEVEVQPQSDEPQLAGQEEPASVTNIITKVRMGYVDMKNYIIIIHI